MTTTHVNKVNGNNNNSKPEASQIDKANDVSIGPLCSNT